VDTPTALDWLLKSDPAIRWQARRDLTDAPSDTITAERDRIPHEGIGAEILASQLPDGSWRRSDAPVWLTTLFTFQLLRATGIDANHHAVTSTVAHAETNLRWNDYPGCWDLRPPDFGPAPVDGRHGCKPGGNPFFEGEEEPCINGGVLAFGAYFGHPNETLAHRLLGEQLPDGGWNCEAPKSRRSSFHTTICVLEGLLAYERAGRRSAAVANARERGENYLLERRLFRSLRSGEVINERWLRFSFPTFWHYDVLRALDYLRDAGAKPDSRLDEAIEILVKRRHQNGRWPLNLVHPDRIPIDMETEVGRASRWNTLRALRVLRWYHNSG
jgi:hypothetical protein